MMMALNVKTENDDGSECRNWEWWWLWMSKLGRDSGSERRDWEWWWLWMPKLRIDDGSECRNWESMMDLNAETEKRWCHQMPKMKIRIWTPNWRCGFERQSEDAALNTNRKINMTTLNVELKMQGDNEGGICTSVTCYYSSQSMKMV